MSYGKTPTTQGGDPNFSGISLMINLNAITEKIQLNGFEESPSSKRIHIVEPIEIARIPDRTRDGKSSVMLIAKLPDGKFVMLEQTLKNIGAAIDLFRAADKDDEEKRGKAKN